MLTRHGAPQAFLPMKTRGLNGRLDGPNPEPPKTRVLCPRSRLEAPWLRSSSSRYARNYHFSTIGQGMIVLVGRKNPQSTVEYQSFSQDGTSERGVSYQIWRGRSMENLRRLWCQDEGQDIAEYAVMLAVILVIVVGTIRLIGSNANHTFSSVASSIQ